MVAQTQMAKRRFTPKDAGRYIPSMVKATADRQVIVITHVHPSRLGIRHLAPCPSLKVYHLPYIPIASNASLPNFLLFLPYLRTILLRERVDVVHGHGSLSSLAHEAILQAPMIRTSRPRRSAGNGTGDRQGTLEEEEGEKGMEERRVEERGVRTVFTDHSLFGFGDAVGVLTNKLLVGALRNVDAVIGVSHTGRENTVLRAQLDPGIVSVIPNAIVADQFRPAAHPSYTSPLNPSLSANADATPHDSYTPLDKPIVISRLVYRKGIDLLVASAPRICAAFPNVKFLVGGDGPKMVELEQMREKYQLQERVELLGAVKPGDVRDVLVKGQIYLNTSLTEAFGISIIEAASAGLFVVATRVGGVAEILPKDMIEFARADEEDVVRALTHAISVIRSDQHHPLEAHERVRGMYDWASVAKRTERVYERVMAQPERDLGERLARLLSTGRIFGPIMCIIIAVQHYFFWFLEWYAPRDEIEYVEDEWEHVNLVKAVDEDKQRYAVAA